MGSTLGMAAVRAVQKAGVNKRVIGVSRFSDPQVAGKLDRAGVETISCDLMDDVSLHALPEVPHVVYMVGSKFGTTGQEARTWAINQVGRTIELPQRLLLLAGRAGGGVIDKGPIVCACFEVGRNQIAQAIDKAGCTSTDAVGLETGAGTNCGSCRAEIGRLIHDAHIA